MNKIFRLIWNNLKEAWVVATEKVRGRGGPAPVTVGALLLAVLLAGGSEVAIALPTGAQIIGGTAGISTSGSTMTITNSHNAIINWQGFNIGANETTRFIQPSALSAVLNRVTGGDPSQILGALQSNGKVLLINPSGIIFGPGARVDVNGLIASSLDIANQDFLAGRMKFSVGPLAGKVENQGLITTPSGGSVYLIAPDVQNSGVITSPNGYVLLAAGKEVLLVDSSNPEIAVVVTAPEGQALNLGTIVADAGRVGLYGSMVRQQGRISADSVVAEGGKIFLKATKQTTLEKNSITSATGSKGGTVQILGEHVGLFDNAAVDVSGKNGGGSVLVGGDYQGKNPAVQNAEAVYMGKDAVIKADAVDSGNGGKVILWSDNATRAYGSIFARGGVNGGDGGFVETSGKWLDVAGIRVATKSYLGKDGSWLLDPFDITISASATTGDVTSDGGAMPTPGTWTPGASGSNINKSDIEGNITGGSITIDTGAAGGEAGDITLSAPLDLGNAGGSTLTLKAHRDVKINAAITGSTTSAGIVLQADQDNNNTGTVFVNAPISVDNSLTLDGHTVSLADSVTVSMGAELAIVAKGGGVTQTAGTITTDKLKVGSGGTVDLSQGNAVGLIAANVTAGSLGLNNTVPYSIGSVGGIDGITASSTVTLHATDAVTQTQPITASGLELLGTGAGTYTLTNSSNTIATLAANVPTGFSYKNNAALAVGTVGSTTGVTAGPVVLDAAGGLTTSAGTVKSDTITLQPTAMGPVGTFGTPFASEAVASSTFVIGNAASNGGYFSHTGTAVVSAVTQATNKPFSFTASGNLSVPTLNTGTADLTLKSTGGNLSLGGNVSGANIFLQHGGGAFLLDKSVSAGSGNVQFTSSGTVTDSVLGGISAQGLELLGTGSFALTAGTYAVQKLAGNMTGAISFNPANTLTIDTVNTTNGLTSGGAITITNTNGSIGVADTPAANDIAAGTALSLTTTVNAGIISLAPGSAVTAGSGVGLSTTLGVSHISIGSGSAITTTTGNIQLSTSAATSAITTAGNYTATAGDITLTSGDTFNLNGGIFTSGTAKTITLASTAGGIAQGGGPVTMTPSAAALVLTPAVGTVVSLGNNSNSILPVINSTGANNLQIHGNANGIKLGNITHSGTLEVITAGTITGSGTITGGAGTSLIAQAAGGITLNGANGIRTVDLANSGSGNVVYTSDIGGGNTLQLTANNTASSSTMTVTEATGAINIASSSAATGMFSLNAAGDLTQSAGAVVGATSLRASGTSVTLTEDNPVGVISGSTSDSDFRYKTVNGIAVDTVDGVAGITAAGLVALESTHATAGIIQNVAAPIVAPGGLKLSSVGPVNLSSSTNNIGSLAGFGNGVTLVNSTDLEVGTVDGVNGLAASPGSINLTAPNITVAASASNVLVSGTNVVLTATQPLTGAITMTGSTGSPSITAVNGVKLQADGSMSLPYSVTATDPAAGGVNLSNYTSGRTMYIGSPVMSTASSCYTAPSSCLIISALPNTGGTTFKSYGADGASPFPTGPIYINAAISRPAGTYLALVGNNSITQEGGSIGVDNFGFKAGGTVALTSSNNLFGTVAGSTTSGGISITNDQDLAIGSISGPGHSATGLTSPTSVTLQVNGAISDLLTAPAHAIVAPSVSLSAQTGIGSGFGQEPEPAPLKTQVSTLSAENLGASGDINILNTGALTTSGWISNGNPSNTAGGRVTIIAKSPVIISGSGATGGISALNEVWLEAGATGTGVTTDNLTIQGDIYSDANKSVTLRAGNSIIETGTIYTTGTITRIANINGPPTCATGYTWNGSACVPIVCPTGTQLVGNTCEAIVCPTGTQLVGNTCEAIVCPTGQQLVGNTCQPIVCPTGQQLVGNTCQPIVCPTGQQLVGNTCTPITCPTGQQLVGNTCTPITCPAGQTLIGGSCVADQQPLQQSSNQVVNALTETKNSPVAPAGLKFVAQAPPDDGPPSSGQGGNSGGGSGSSDGGNNADDKDKDKDKNQDSQDQPPTGGGKQDDKPKKNYCN